MILSFNNMCRKLKVSIGILMFVSYFHCSCSNLLTEGYTLVKDERQYPFVAALTSRAGACTGTVVNKDYVLTAAHCFYSKGKKIGDRDVKIWAGVLNYYVPKADTKQDTMSEKIIIHPNFGEKDVSKYDVALVQVRESFTFTDYVKPIKIASDGWPQINNQSANCLVLGFGGFRSSAPPTTDLKVWNVSATHSQKGDVCKCARRFERKRIVCVKETHYPMLCAGDDGGPLVCGNVVRGIAHMVWDRYLCEPPTYPQDRCRNGPEKGESVFFFLCVANDWLHGLVNDIDPRPESCDATFLSTCSTSLVVSLFYLFLCNYRLLCIM